MNEQGSTRRRDWIKNATIVFLIVMLILTFFSNTIMNYSLPEVSAEYVSSGTITTKVRGSGTVTAGDIWQVYPEESLKVISVDVKEGDEVQEGDLLFTLELEEEEYTASSYGETASAQIAAAEEVVRSAEEALRKAREDYETFLLSPDLTIEVSELLQTGGSLSFGDLQEQVNVYRSENEAIEEKKQPYEDVITELQELLRQAQNNNDTDEITRLQNVISINQAYVDELNADIADNEEEINKLIASYEAQAEFQDLEAAISERQTDLAEAKAELAWLKEKLSEDTEETIDPEVKAPVSGTVKTVNVKKGKTASTDEVAVEIYPEGEDYTMTLTVTTEQAQSLSRGDVAELQ
ncbi:MAG: HlyD family secretion protein, partial [Lachnospiraceae bacterium]|nr:HlyD family secretion protein [Lachnospiraceae bacterium]